MSLLYVNSCCCTCLCTENLQSLQTKDAENVKLIDKLLFCMSEKDSILECAPLLICDKCNKMLLELYRFKKSGLKNLDLFRNCLQQLIRNPFVNLTIRENAITNERQSLDNQLPMNIDESPTQPSSEQQPTPTIKSEMSTEEQENSQQLPKQELVQRNNENNSTNSNPSADINNAESLNKNYRNPLAKLTKTKKSSGPKRISSDTMCKPCGKKFVRHDYYIKHILMCPKNDLKTKNSVLLWAEKNKKLVIKDNGASFQLANNSFQLNKTSENIVSKDEMENIQKKRARMERSSCPKCRRSIAIPFMKRHQRNCRASNKMKTRSSDSSERSDTSDESDDNFYNYMANKTV